MPSNLTLRAPNYTLSNTSLLPFFSARGSVLLHWDSLGTCITTTIIYDSSSTHAMETLARDRLSQERPAQLLRTSASVPGGFVHVRVCLRLVSHAVYRLSTSSGVHADVAEP
jgi:hypothetical protein